MNVKPLPVAHFCPSPVKCNSTLLIGSSKYKRGKTKDENLSRGQIACPCQRMARKYVQETLGMLRFLHKALQTRHFVNQSHIFPTNSFVPVPLHSNPHITPLLCLLNPKSEHQFE